MTRPVVYRPDVQIGLIQGQTPDSVNEWFVAQALDKLRLQYYYQFVIDGGTSLRGGQTIDFLVQAAGWIPVYVNGEYWHNARNDPELTIKLAAAEQEFGRRPIILEEDETNTLDKAFGAVRRKIQ